MKCMCLYVLKVAQLMFVDEIMMCLLLEQINLSVLYIGQSFICSLQNYQISRIISFFHSVRYLKSQITRCRELCVLKKPLPLTRTREILLEALLCIRLNLKLAHIVCGVAVIHLLNLHVF